MPTLQDGRASVNVSANKTLAAGDSGTVQNVVADGVTITLPASATAVVRAGGVTAGGAAGSNSGKSQAVIVSGTVAGLGGGALAATLTLAKADQRVGDEIEVVNGVITRVVGAWTRA